MDNVFLVGDGSRLCEDCLKEMLVDVEGSSNITVGVECDADGLPLYGWSHGKCTNCNPAE